MNYQILSFVLTIFSFELYFKMLNLPCFSTIQTSTFPVSSNVSVSLILINTQWLKTFELKNYLTSKINILKIYSFWLVFKTHLYLCINLPKRFKKQKITIKIEIQLTILLLEEMNFTLKKNKQNKYLKF